MQNLPTKTFFYASLLQGNLRIKDPLVPKQVHAQVIKCSLHLGLVLMNNLLNAYSKTGFILDAHKLFDEMPLKTTCSWNTLISAYIKEGYIEMALCLFNRMPVQDSVSWTTMIVGYNRIGRFGRAVRMFVEMIRRQFVPTEYDMTNILGGCASFRALDIGRKVHSLAVKLGSAGYVSVANSLLNMYAKTGDEERAKIVFDRITLKHVSTFNTIISLHMQYGRFDCALDQFQQMDERNIVSWNSMISGYKQHGLDVEALNIFRKMMIHSLLKPDRFTLGSVLSACANFEVLKLGKEVHAYIIRTGFDTAGAVGNALISMYSKCGGVEIARRILEQSAASSINVISFTALLDGYTKLGDIGPARQIFDLLRDPDVVAWTAMLVGYVQNGFSIDAMEFFRLMIQKGPKPNNYTLASMLSVCSSLASLSHGRQIHAVAFKLEEASSVSVGNALITMYAKAGNVNCARRVFNVIQREKDAVSFTSMILALAQHGLGEEAIQLFENMLSLGLNPDHITYVGVLSACTHVGLVEQGRSYYKKMKDVHRIEPSSSHYACMIDLFGRAGLLDEAKHVIETMPIEPDIVAWGSLLASCRVHKNPDMALVAAERLLSIEPENSGAYASLANVYSACGKWKEAAKIRKSMKHRQVKKDQGLSWLQIKNSTHVFGVEDCLHPQRVMVFQMMDKIWEEIKKLGFTPDTESVLHDLDLEVKEQILKRHSEKLAIAFGLINTPEYSTLRIMKNLRVCNDCHTAIKYISRLVCRDIIVRDATRFHHFKNGSCSCRDYW